MADYIFLIGPGGAGKSTVGKILSATLGYNLIDLDDEFCERIMNIRDYIRSYGYGSYLEKNSALLEGLLNQRSGDNILFILSSGFSSTDTRSDIVEYNRKLIKTNGFSVLLMPSRHYEEALECIMDRQLNRGLSLVREKEQEKFSLRFHEYSDIGNLKIFSMEAPEFIACEIANQLGRRPAH